jgi:hypothetical protein
MEEVGFGQTGIVWNGGSRFWPHQSSLRNYWSHSVKLGEDWQIFRKGYEKKNKNKKLSWVRHDQFSNRAGRWKNGKKKTRASLDQVATSSSHLVKNKERSWVSNNQFSKRAQRRTKNKKNEGFRRLGGDFVTPCNKLLFFTRCDVVGTWSSTYFPHFSV